MLVYALGYLLFASGQHFLLVNAKPPSGAYDGVRRFRKDIYDQFKIGGNLNPSNWPYEHRKQHTLIHMDSSSSGDVFSSLRPASGNSQATTLMANQKAMICQDDEQCAYRPQGDKCINRTYGLPVGTLEKKFEGHGKATLKFKNCNDIGFIQIFLNKKPIQVEDELDYDAYFDKNHKPKQWDPVHGLGLQDKQKKDLKWIQKAEFVYKSGDILEVKEEKGATIKISSLILARLSEEKENENPGRYSSMEVPFGSSSDPRCPGDLVFGQCYSSCEPVCGEVTHVICTRQCVAGCGCPNGLYRSSKTGHNCYRKPDCPKIEEPKDDCFDCGFARQVCCKYGNGTKRCEYPKNCPTYGKENGMTKQCKDGTRGDCPFDSCNTAGCSNGCVTGCTERYCVDDETLQYPTWRIPAKDENQLCGLVKNNCKDGLKCISQTDGCDNGVGRCVKTAESETCDDDLQNQGESGVDCGGPCPACPSCKDGIQNQGETGIDCGGPCTTCENAECRDMSHRCKNTQAFCNNNTFKNRCKKTCGLCVKYPKIWDDWYNSQNISIGPNLGERCGNQFCVNSQKCCRTCDEFGKPTVPNRCSFRCPKVFCQPVQATTKRPDSGGGKNKGQTGSAGCQNKESYCELARPDCKTSRAMQDCKKYCGLCQTSSCVNKEPWCEAAKPDCTTSFAKKNCKKYCGLCGDSASAKKCTPGERKPSGYCGNSCICGQDGIYTCTRRGCYRPTSSQIAIISPGSRSLQLQTPQTESKMSNQKEFLPRPPKANGLRALSPKFGKVEGWMDCMGSKDMGTWKAHCLPTIQPETCKLDAWFQLIDLFKTDEVMSCEEKRSKSCMFDFDCEHGHRCDKISNTCQDPKCPGDLVFDQCYSACEPICGEETPSICTLQCVAGCGCPNGLYRSSETGDKCYKKEDCPKTSKCPGDLVYSNCHSACPPYCNVAAPDACITVCVSGCECPRGLYRDSDRCYKNNECPSPKIDSGNASEYEEEIDLDIKRNNAQKMRVGSAVQSPLNVLLGLESMPKIVGGKIIAGDSSNARVTLLKKLPDLDNYTPTDYQYTPEYSIDDEEYSIY